MTEKEKFLRAFNEAFANGDLKTLEQSITEDVVWEIPGDRTYTGKTAFVKAVQQMTDCSTKPVITLQQVVTHGSAAAIQGTITGEHNGKAQTWSFCDMYVFSGFKHPLIKKLTSYVIAVDR